MAKDTVIYNHDGLEIPVDDWKHGEHSFIELTHVIQSTHDAAQTCAVKAINRMQTMRNWLIGYYIVEFEQHGKDRAEYGSRLLKKLEEKVERKGLNVTLFQWARKFYNLYPQMADNLVPMNFIKDNIIRKTKCSLIFKRSASFQKTKRNFSRLSPTPLNFKKNRPASPERNTFEGS